MDTIYASLSKMGTAGIIHVSIIDYANSINGNESLTVMNLLVYTEWNSSKVERIVTFFHALPVDSQNTQLISRDHHLRNVYTRNAFYITVKFYDN